MAWHGSGTILPALGLAGERQRGRERERERGREQGTNSASLGSLGCFWANAAIRAHRATLPPAFDSLIVFFKVRRKWVRCIPDLRPRLGRLLLSIPLAPPGRHRRRRARRVVPSPSLSCEAKGVDEEGVCRAARVWCATAGDSTLDRQPFAVYARPRPSSFAPCWSAEGWLCL